MSTLLQHSFSPLSVCLSVFPISTQSWFSRARRFRSGTCFCRHSWGSKRVRHVPHPSVEKQTKPKLAAGQRSVNMLCWTSHCKAKNTLTASACWAQPRNMIIAAFLHFCFDSRSYSRWSGRGVCCYNVSKTKIKGNYVNACVM